MFAAVCIGFVGLLGLSVVGIAAAAVAWMMMREVWRVAEMWLLRPWRIRRAMKAQGIGGPQPCLLSGNLAEMSSLRDSMASQDMPTISHDIVARILPHYIKWSKQYGQRFIFWWGAEPRLCITEPELIKEVLSSKHGLSLGKSHLQQQGVKDFIGKGLLMANGDEWAMQRRVIAPAFHHENIKGHVSYMVESTRALLERWKAKIQSCGGEAEIEVSEHFSRLASDIIARTEFGSSFEQGKRVFQKLTEMQRLTSRAGRHNRFSLTRMRMERDVARLKAEVEQSLQRVLQARRDAVSMGRTCSYGNDLLGLVLSAAHKHGWSLQQLMDQCKTFYFAGQDTTSTLLTWTTMLLALHPEWQQRARHEILTVCGGPAQAQAPTAQHLSKLKIMGMILNESLRLYTPANLFAKEAFTDIKVGDVVVPRGLSLWIPVLAIHHDRRIWGDDADEFRPERFQDGERRPGAPAWNPAAFMPFSYGPRKCVGQSFAMMEAKLVLAIMLSSLRFVLSPTYRHAPISVLTLKPKHGVQIFATALP